MVPIAKPTIIAFLVAQRHVNRALTSPK